MPQEGVFKVFLGTIVHATEDSDFKITENCVVGVQGSKVSRKLTIGTYRFNLSAPNILPVFLLTRYRQTIDIDGHVNSYDLRLHAGTK